MSLRAFVTTILGTALLAGCSAGGDGGTDVQEVNLYSARHYDSDLALYDRFTKETGIKINRIEGNADQLIARMKSEGAIAPLTCSSQRMQARFGEHRKPDCFSLSSQRL